MKVLICRDDGQLRRIDSAIAAIESAQPCQRENKLALLQALRIERAALLQHARPSRATMIGAAKATQHRPAWLTQTCGVSA